jgi:serine/threonine protein kinase
MAAPDAPDRLEQLFLAAQARPPEERAAFLDAACADDDALRIEVESLLAADAVADANAFLVDPVRGYDAALRAAAPPAEDAMDEQHIGPYHVLQLLGRGGMGDVYLAIREEPFRRYVALKVIRRGMDSHDVVARFAIERQILASLDHPGIARLLDGGVSAGGRPYFAMEYVEGQPITDYCDERRLTISERLRLFVDVCEAVHVAHQSLVLHRDLKPSNILVTARGKVKLLDFGIAKLLSPQLSHLPVPITRAETRMLTPEYASPEQIRGEPLTTTSDIYSLGVLLYELLAGRRPHRLSGRSTQEIVRIVSDEPPENPSTAVTRTLPDPTVRAEPDAVATARNLTSERLQRRLRGDLDAIVQNALRKEPHRRYGSAELMAQDVERHLAREPVAARRGTRRYRLASLIRRHRVEAVAVAAVLVSLIGGLGAALWQAEEARRERDRTQTEASKVAEVSGFLVSLFEQADPTQAVGDTLTVRQVLDKGAARVEAELTDQPEVQASLFSVIAEAYRNLGRPTDARPLAERALDIRRAVLGRDHPDTAQSLDDLAQIHVQLGDFARAETLLREVLADVRRLRGPDEPQVLVALNDLSNTLYIQGRHSEADSMYVEWRALMDAMPDEDHPALAASLSDLSNILFIRREYAEAEAYGRRALAMNRRLYGDTSLAVGVNLNDLADLLNRMGRYDEADRAARDALALHRIFYPLGHEEVESSLAALGESLRYRGRYDEAATYLHEHLHLSRRLYPDGHYSLAGAYGLLGKLEYSRKRYADSERWYRDAIDAWERLYGPDFPTAAEMRCALADVLSAQGRYAEAETFLLVAYAALAGRRGQGANSENIALSRLVKLYEVWGKPEEAARYRSLYAAEAAQPSG